MFWNSKVLLTGMTTSRRWNHPDRQFYTFSDQQCEYLSNYKGPPDNTKNQFCIDTSHNWDQSFGLPVWFSKSQVSMEEMIKHLSWLRCRCLTSTLRRLSRSISSKFSSSANLESVRPSEESWNRRNCTNILQTEFHVKCLDNKFSTQSGNKQTVHSQNVFAGKTSIIRRYTEGTMVVLSEAKLSVHSMHANKAQLTKILQAIFLQTTNLPLASILH